MNSYQPESEAILSQLAKASKSDLYRVTKFSGYREHPAGGMKEITVEIHDRGESDSSRWSVHATDDEGRQANGNHGDNLEAVIAMVHWQDLDRP